MLLFRFLNKNWFLVFILLISFSSYSQGEAAIWYFGANAGLDFNSGAPVVLSNGQLNTSEGCSTISNPNGELLFYSDGITVWDKNHNVMPNGTGLMGDPSSTQSAVIVPNPNDINFYYIFTVDLEAEEEGLRYSEVDMSLNNGLGEVTQNKNIELTTPTTEKISAVLHDNGNDIWVMTHGWQNNEFLAFLVTGSGVNTTPVVSNAGTIHTGDSAETIGYMKFSPNGERLALAKWYEDTYVEVFDFDSATGVVSNAVHIDGMFYEGAQNGAYGLEFSMNSQLLYVSDTNFSFSGSKVHQFDVSLPTEEEINESDVVVYDHSTNIVSALQLAIDQKIYVSNNQIGALDVIENPDIQGVGCNYVEGAVNITSGSPAFGLPPFIQLFFSVGIEYEDTCLGNTTVFTMTSTEDVISVLWDFGDGNTSTELSPNHVYGNSGEYLVQLTVETADEIKTFERNITIYNVPVAHSVSDFEACDDSSNDNQFEFDLTTKNIEVYEGQSQVEFTINYFASMQDAENHENVLPDTYINTSNNQEVFAKIYNAQNNDCYDIISFQLIVNEFPIANPVEDIITCDNEVADNSQALVFGNITPTVLGSQSDEIFEVSYHLNIDDANSGNAALPNIYSTETNPQEIFYRIQNIESPECYEVASFNVFVDGQIIAYPPDNLYECDDDSNDGFAVFNLTDRNDQIINNQVGDYVITFYVDEIDAIESNNAIGNTYTNTNTDEPETIYARIERADNSNCFDVTSFDIDVVHQPVFDFEPLYYLCTGEEVTLTVPSGFDGYLWSNDATTSSIIVTEAGSYDITVFEAYPLDNSVVCTRTETIQVVESDEAIFQEFEINDWTSSSNSITVFVEGIGDYEYSLDNVNFQDSNVFSNLVPGEYEVYIRDKNGCGTIVEDIYLMYYPKYFTPNGDMYHPLWQIKFARYEPNMEILIFNRYGKFLLSLDPQSPGWDGTYNGALMPSDDYWFVVKRPSNGKTYKGHFTLKR